MDFGKSLAKINLERMWSIQKKKQETITTVKNTMVW